MNNRLGTIDPAMATEDKFLDMIQGPTFQVTVGTKTPTFEPQIYHLPRALLSAHSGFFRDEIAQQIAKLSASNTSSTAISNSSTSTATPEATKSITTPPPTIKVEISLLTTDPVAFGLFLRFVYQGRASFDPQPNHPFGPGTISLPQHNSSGLQASLFPPSIYAWILGVFLRAPAFQNHVLQYTHAALGRTIFLTPQLVSWIYTHIGHKGPDDALGRLTLDTLISYWAEPTMHVIKSVDMNNAWMKVFAEFPVLHREFLFGLQRKNVPLPQPYMVETPGNGLGGYGPTYRSRPSPAALSAAARAKKEPQQQAGHVPKFGLSKKSGESKRSGSVKKKDVPQLVIKQEEQSSPLSRMPFASESKNGRFADPTPAATSTQPQSQFAIPITTQNQHNPGRTAPASTQRHSRSATPITTPNQEYPGSVPDLSKKRSASPLLVHNNPKLQRLLPKSAAEVENLDMKKSEEEKSATATITATTQPGVGEKETAMSHDKEKGQMQNSSAEDVDAKSNSK